MYAHFPLNTPLNIFDAYWSISPCCCWLHINTHFTFSNLFPQLFLSNTQHSTVNQNIYRIHTVTNWTFCVKLGSICELSNFETTIQMYKMDCECNCKDGFSFQFCQSGTQMNIEIWFSCCNPLEDPFIMHLQEVHYVSDRGRNPQSV